MKTTIIHVRKIGLNRGVPRLWLEGNILLEHGFTHRSGFDVEPSTNGLTITLNKDGKRHIAGSPDRPIIDICSKVLLDELSGLTVDVHCSKGLLIIKG